jgi:hypothetical protein
MNSTDFNVALARLGLSGAAFAREIDYSPRAISMWRTGESPIPKLIELYLELRLRVNKLGVE